MPLGQRLHLQRQTSRPQRRASLFAAHHASAFESYVLLIEQEVLNYVATETSLQGLERIIDGSKIMAGITILTAARTLQGDDLRAKLSAECAELYHDLDMGLNPVNFIMPWAPLPHNRKREGHTLK